MTMALLFILLVLAKLTNILFAESITFGNEYNFEETVLFNDGTISGVGYQIKGLLRLEWLNKNLYLIRLENPKLFVYSKRKRNTYSFIPHISSIENHNSNPFIIELIDGKVEKIFISRGDGSRIINIKKSISNLFQFQSSNFQGEEIDLSGSCKVKYELKNPNHIIKTKDDCVDSDILKSKTVWGGTLRSNRKTDIYLENENVASITSWEDHIFIPNLGSHIKANVSSKLEIRIVGSEICKEKFPSEENKQIVLKMEAEIGEMFEIYDLTPVKAENSCVNCPKFAKIISENGEHLGDKDLGTLNSASVFKEAIKAARRSNVQEIYNVLRAKKNKKILPQLFDILGVAQTNNTHQAAVSFLKIDTAKCDFNLCERYLWSLSMAPIIDHHILKDLQRLVQNKHQNSKLWQTMILTLAAVVRKYDTQVGHSTELVTETIEFLSSKLRECSEDNECQQIYIKAFCNIPDERALPLLIEIIENSGKKSGAKAMKVISKMNPKLWDKHVIQLAEKVLLSNNSVDSSTKIFAVDILLQSKPSYIQLCRIVSILKEEDKSRELKEYLIQRLSEFADSNDSFSKLLKKVYAENGYYNYDAFSQDGLSTTFSRFFMSNGTLSTSQEIVGGVLKQGSVNVNLLYNGETHTPFTLGIFAGGLSSFVTDDENAVDDDEVSTAGLELTVLGVELRPFVFFSGAGELTGHVWSGTASTLTPAYQALLLLEESTFPIPLAIGEILTVRSESSASVDLSGKIEISLWNRNAKSLVLNRAGVLIENNLSINAPYIKADINIDIGVEPELHLSADLDFSKGASLCLRLQQPDSVVKYNSYKTEKIPELNHLVKRSRQINIPVPGKTYALNAKNNGMCNSVFNY